MRKIRTGATLAILAALLQGHATAQTRGCDFLTDPDCKREPSRDIDLSPRGSIAFPQIQDVGLGNELALGRDQPATLGAITFSGSNYCIGLLNRGSCR